MSAITTPSSADILSLAPSDSSAFAVFIDSSIDTHLAILVHHEDTVDQLKRKIKDAHAACFPSFGEIIVDAIKVKRGDFFYHLAASMLVGSAFHGLEGTRLIYVDVVPVSVSKHQTMIAKNAGHTFMEKNADLCKPDKHVYSEDLSSKLINENPLRTSSGKVRKETSTIKVTAVEDISFGSEVLPDLGVKKSDRRKRKSTKIELPNNERREEAPAKDLIRQPGSILLHTVVEPKPSFHEEAASLGTSSNMDLIKHSNVIIDNLIHNTDSTVANIAPDATDVPKNGIKKSHKGKKRRGKVEAPACDYAESDIVASLIKETAEINHGKPLGNLNDMHRRPEQAVSICKSPVAESLTEADEVAPTNSQIALETNAMCSREVADHNRNSDVILSESIFHVGATDLGNIIDDNYVDPSKKKLHLSRKKLAKRKSNHELLKSDLSDDVGNQSFERSIGDNVGINNTELDNGSKPTTFSSGAVDIKHNLEMDSAFHLNSYKADTLAVEVKSGENAEDHHNGRGKRTRKSIDLVEVSVPENSSLAEPNEVPGIAKKKLRHGRKKETTEGSKAFSVNDVIENGKKLKVATTVGENDIVNVAEISKLSASINGTMQRQQKKTGAKTEAFMTSELIRTSGNHVAEGTMNVALDNNPKTLSDHPPIERILSEYNISHVEHNDNDSHQNTAPTNGEVECTQLPKTSEGINFHEFFVSGVTQSTSGEEFSSKKAAKVLCHKKSKGRNRKLEKDVSEAAQALLKPSSSVERSIEKKISCNVESVGQGLDGSTEAFPCHKENSGRVLNGETKMMPLDPQALQNQKPNSVEKKMNFVDPSDNSTQVDTTTDNKRYRIAVRKAPGRKFTGFHSNSIQKKNMVSHTIFQDATSGSSDDEYEKRNIMESGERTLDNSTSSDSEDENEEVQRTLTGVESIVYQYKNERSPNVSRNNISIRELLKGTSSYKKADKPKASQTRPDPESQPVDVVLESQLGSGSP